MKVSLLSSGYWHVRFSSNQFIQWPVGRSPRTEDGFGWLTQAHFDAALAAFAERRQTTKDQDLAHVDNLNDSMVRATGGKD
jgi:hypothetical protein